MRYCCALGGLVNDRFHVDRYFYGVRDLADWDYCWLRCVGVVLLSKIAIVRTDAPSLSAEEVELFRKFLFGILQGFRPEDQKAWNRFWNRVVRAEPGELFSLETIFPRNYEFHKKFFALLTVGFDAWVPCRKRYSYKGVAIQKNFDRFREQVLILAGYYDQVFSLTGKMEMVAKSISFAAMDDAEFDALYQSVVTVLLEKVLSTYRGREELESVVERILGFA